MRILLLTSNPHLNFVYTKVKKYLSQNDFQISIRGTPNFENYDVGISFMYLHKVPKEQVESHTWINFHPAPLPEYKGRNLCYHAIMNGEKEFGASVHYMDEGFDTGDIIEVVKCPVEYDDTAWDLMRLALGFSMQLFSKYLPEIIDGVGFTRYKNEGGTYYKKEPIDDFIGLTDYQDRKLRAITCGDFYPKIDSGGVIYKIVRDE